MTYDDMLKNIEYLREKADVSYEEAAALLEKYEGNVMRALVDLERQGRIYPRAGETNASAQAQGKSAGAKATAGSEKKKGDPKKTFSKAVSEALRHRVVVERGPKGERETVANLSAPYCAGAAIVAPHLLVGSVALMFAMGYRVRINKTPKEQSATPDDVEAFVNKTVSNIKETASSFAQTAKDNCFTKDDSERPEDTQATAGAAEDDEGGEVTIE